MKNIHVVVGRDAKKVFKGISCITSDQFIAHVLAVGYTQTEEKICEEVEEWELVEDLNDLRDAQKDVYKRGIHKLIENLPDAVKVLLNSKIKLSNEEIRLLINGLQRILSER